jgi:hypothetical protein
MAFPILAGLALGALMGGGIAALQKKDILQGALMGGIGGAVGGAFMPGVAGGVVGEGVASGVAPAVAEGATSSILAGSPGAGVLVNNTPLMTQAIAPAVAPSFAPAAVAGAGGGGGGLGSFLGANKYVLGGGALGGMLAGDKEPNPSDQGNIYTTEFSQERNPEFGMVAGAPYFKPQQYAAGSYSKAKDYDPTMSAATGGLVALAEGGNTSDARLIDRQFMTDTSAGVVPVTGNPMTGNFMGGNPMGGRGTGGGMFGVDTSPMTVEANRYAAPVRAVDPAVAAYNQQLMSRANQQYNINARPLPNQVPGTAEYIASRPASTSAAQDSGPKDYIDEYYQQMLGRNADPTGRGLIESAVKRGDGYDPAKDIAETIRSSEEFKLSGKNANPTGIEIGKTYESGSQSSGLTYNPNTGRYEGEFAAPGKGKKSELEKLRDEMDAMRGGSSYNHAAGDSAGGSGAGANGGLMPGALRYNMGGLSSLGAYSDGGQLLKGPGDGVSDDIPAQIGARQPARLADGEFVVPARIVSELGNGSTDAGAKRLYAMMDRVQKGRKKSVGKGKVAVDSKAHKMLPA